MKKYLTSEATCRLTAKQEQLARMRDECERLGTIIGENPDHPHYFTATVREAWADDGQRARAALIQRGIRFAAEQYPDIVCYCFDTFSTLIYVI